MKTAEEVIKEETGIHIGADKLTPMDYGECIRCMEAYKSQPSPPVTEVRLDHIAMNIVNQLFDIAEVPVNKRQEINDVCDEFVKKLINSYTTPTVTDEEIDYIWRLMPEWIKEQPEGLNPTFYGTMSATGDKAVSDKVKDILYRIKNNK